MTRLFTKDSLPGWIVAFCVVISTYLTFAERNKNAPNVYALGESSMYILPTDYWNRIVTLGKYKAILSLTNKPIIKEEISKFHPDTIFQRLENNYYSKDIIELYNKNSYLFDSSFINNVPDMYRTQVKIFVRNNGKKIKNVKLYFDYKVAYWFSDDVAPRFYLGFIPPSEKLTYAKSHIIELGDIDNSYTKTILLWTPVPPSPEYMSNLKLTYDEGDIPIVWQELKIPHNNIYISYQAAIAWIITFLFIGFFLNPFFKKLKPLIIKDSSKKILQKEIGK